MEILKECFKPEIRKSGEDCFRKDQVYLSVASDTQVQALIKAGTGARVRLKSPAITSTEIEALCSCPAFSKGQLCKHIWAAVLATKKRHPDFLESKEKIFTTPVEESPAILERKAKQTEFRTAQAARLKERSKQQRLEKKKLMRSVRQFGPSYPPDVQEALDYFDQNGFALKDSLNEKSIQLAKRNLSRIFHPDKGGSHEEVLALNHYSDVLLKSLD